MIAKYGNTETLNLVGGGGGVIDENAGSNYTAARDVKTPQNINIITPQKAAQMFLHVYESMYLAFRRVIILF